MNLYAGLTITFTGDELRRLGLNPSADPAEWQRVTVTDVDSLNRTITIASPKPRARFLGYDSKSNRAFAQSIATA